MNSTECVSNYNNNVYEEIMTLMDLAEVCLNGSNYVEAAKYA